MNDMNMGAAGAPVRPKGLKVICILAFILLSLAILGGVFGWFGMKMLASGRMEEMTEQSGNTEAMDKLAEMRAKVEATGLTVDQFASMCLYASALAVVALIGAIMMWRLRKAGFYLFAGAEVVAILLPFLMGGRPIMEAQTFVSWGITILFIGLFASNLKYMR